MISKERRQKRKGGEKGRGDADPESKQGDIVSK